MARFLRNCWYVACSGAEIGEGPLARTLLETPVVIYRSDDGSPAALKDRCPHRFVPLSMGKMTGNAIQCLYHGLRFDRTGACVRNPHDDGALERFRVEAYPVVERYGYVWIWFGQPELADSAKLANLPFLHDEPRFRTVRGYLHLDANYELITDNLLDLSHVEFLHPLLARDDGVAAHKVEILRNGDSVVANRWKPNSKPNGFLRMFWKDPPDRSPARPTMTWSPPGILSFDLGACAVGGDPQEGLCTPAAHLLTPETLCTTHYFWAQARNQRLEDAGLDNILWDQTNRIFSTEDRPVIEAQQRAMGAETNILALKPQMFTADAPTVMARRTLARLIAQEAEISQQTSTA